MPVQTVAGSSAITIDRLALRLTGYAESDGRRLAELIAEGLAASHCSLEDADLPGFQSSLTATPGSALRGLAGEAVADILRRLQRSE
jgi:hypothetical protein